MTMTTDHYHSTLTDDLHFTRDNTSPRRSALYPGAPMPETLQTTTTFSIEGYRITEYKGLVRGIVVRSPPLGHGFLVGLQQIVGGQLGSYPEWSTPPRAPACAWLLR